MAGRYAYRGPYVAIRRNITPSPINEPIESGSGSRRRGSPNTERDDDGGLLAREGRVWGPAIDLHRGDDVGASPSDPSASWDLKARGFRG